ncbi:hypothetical protein AaE_007902, partial [Aphanomyces astaci]
AQGKVVVQIVDFIPNTTPKAISLGKDEKQRVFGAFSISQKHGGHSVIFVA